MKTGFFYRLIGPLISIGVRIMVAWSARSVPHALALKNFGIRIVADNNTGTWDNHEEAFRALGFLNKYDEERFALVKKHIRIIYLQENYGRRSGYFQAAQLCVIDARKFSDCHLGTIPICIAGLLVYYAAFAKFNVPFWCMSEEIKQYCVAEQKEVVDKLEEILCE